MFTNQRMGIHPVAQHEIVAPDYNHQMAHNPNYYQNEEYVDDHYNEYDPYMDQNNHQYQDYDQGAIKNEFHHQMNPQAYQNQHPNYIEDPHPQMIQPPRLPIPVIEQPKPAQEPAEEVDEYDPLQNF